MVKRKILLLVFCVAGLLCFISCKNRTQHHYDNAGNKVGNESGGDKKYQFGIHLTKGQKYYYTIKTEIQTKLEVNDKKVETEKESEIGLIYNVLKDSVNTFLLKITYNKLHIVLKKTDTEDQVLDADNEDNSFNTIDKLLNNIKGSSIIITINSKGDILNYTGSKEVSDKIMGIMATEDIETQKKVQQLISKLTGDGFVNENLKEGFKIFPDSSLYVGDSWNRKITQSADMKFEVNSKYTLTSLDDGIAEISVEGKIDNTNNAATDYMGYSVTTDLNGNQEAEFKADIISGLLMYGKTSTTIKGNIQVSGKEVPVKIKIKKEITAKKI